MSKVVYEGSRVEPTGYRVWRGFRGSNGASFQSSEIHSRLSSAIKSAKRWERKGYDTKITEEGEKP